EHLPRKDQIRAVTIGRSQHDSQVASVRMREIVHAKVEIGDLKVIADRHCRFCTNKVGVWYRQAARNSLRVGDGLPRTRRRAEAEDKTRCGDAQRARGLHIELQRLAGSKAQS